MLLFTILHISDLHRSPNDPLSNNELISSLIADRDQYVNEEPAVHAPEAIIVSGDLVQGLPLDSPNYPEDLEAQYQEAYDFLVELTTRFVDGDRSKVILVPGNHDIDWNASFAAMEIIEDSRVPKDIYKLIANPDSGYRWDWQSRSAYWISDEAKYKHRLSFFDNLIEQFYAELSLPSSIGSNNSYGLFELDGGRIAVAAFNSCTHNDCFCRIGHIPMKDIAECHMDLRDTDDQYLLKIAVWHHNTDGSPATSDFMDPDIVRFMINKGFRLGLHGHNHKSDFTPFTIEVSGEQQMAVVSTGSLCAGREALPSGVNRQYNVIEIGDDYATARIHVREISSIPQVFRAGRLNSLGAKSYVDIYWPPWDRQQAYGQPDSALASRTQTQVLRAEHDLYNGNYQDAIDTLGPILHLVGSHGRMILAETLRRSEDWAGVICYFGEPTNTNELTLLIHAHTTLEEYDDAIRSLELFADKVSLPDQTRLDLEMWVYAERDIHA